MYVWHDDGTSAPRKRDFENDITSFKDLPRCCSLPHALLLLQHHIKQVRIGMWHSPFCQLSSECNGLYDVQRGPPTRGSCGCRQGYTRFDVRGGTGQGGLLSCGSCRWCSVVSEGCALSIPGGAANKAGTAASTAQISATAPTTWSAFNRSNPMSLSRVSRSCKRGFKGECIAQTTLFPLPQSR